MREQKPLLTSPDSSKSHLKAVNFVPFIVTSALFSPIGSGKALHGHVISSLNDTNAIECMKLCLVTEQCKSFNFSHQLKKCEVSGSTAKAHDLEDHKGFNYYEPPSFQAIYT